jgi:acyl-CoA synthetase (AMP-forming)/AMP-acid ligase II
VAIVDDDMVSRLAAAPGVDITSRSRFEAASLGDSGALVRPAAEPEIAVLLFTSGTTGEPKATVLRHGHLASYVMTTVAFASADEDEAVLVSVPPYHIAGISAVLTGVFAARRIVYLPAFSPEGWVDAAVSERVTNAMLVPTMLNRVLDVLEARKARLCELRVLAYGGGRMPATVIERAMLLLPNVDFVNAYGLTETSSTVAVLGPDDHRNAHLSDDPVVRRRLQSVGRPLPGIELEIRGRQGQALGPGVQGEICVRGEQISGEYVGEKLRLSDGWFHTNDSGWLDDGGYLFIDGRLDDVIVRGGENISPGEIEDVLRAHPTVADAAVFGAPDDEWGERVLAVVVPRGEAPDRQALKAWVRARLRSARTPEEIHFLSELPYNDTGKLLRRVLRSQFASDARAPA